MRPLRFVLYGALSAALVACGGGPDAAGTAGNPSDALEGTAEPTVRTASEPADPCDWIPISEVEAVIGKLAEPPRRADGCLYTMVMPEAVSAERQNQIAQEERLNEQLKAQFKDWEPPEFSGPMANYRRDPKTYAVTLSVDVRGDMAGEIGTAAGFRVAESWLPAQPGGEQGPTEEPAEADGWDAPLFAPYGFAARIGHVQISVLGQAPDVPLELSRALAARVRDRVPDLPFPATNPYQIPFYREEKHPCSLLTREEAEAVLGPLIVEPYRSSSEWPPLVHSKGHACAYFTAGHHVFALAPTWTSGEEDFSLEKGLGGLIGIAPREDVVFKGPWDSAQVGLTGELLFLKGERLLTVHYLTSSTDRRGAVRLAAQAIQRM